MDNIIRAVFCGSRYTTTKSAWLIDHGMVLQIKGVELPEVYEVDFSNSKTEKATRVLGNADGVVIPDKYFLNNAQQIYAWVYLITGDSGFTTLQITIPLSQRPDVSSEPPTPQEKDLIEQAIAALNDGVERAETAADDAETAAAGAKEAAENVKQTVEDALREAKESGEFDGRDGKDGSDGKDGKNGATFIPDVDADGNLSWKNDGDLPNPQTRNIRGPEGKEGGQGPVGATPELAIGTVETLAPGAAAKVEISGTPENPVLDFGLPQGEPGNDYVLTSADKVEIAGLVSDMFEVTVSGTTPVIAAANNTRYICGEVSTLDITLPASGIVDVVFTSGSTPTVLTITPPTGVTLKWANGFDPTALEANKTYELNICNGLGVAVSWT